MGEVSIGVERGFGECWQWQASGQCSKGRTVFSDTMRVSVWKSIPKATQSSEPLKERDERKSSRRRSFRGSSPSGRPSRPPCGKYLRGDCTTPSCSYWHLPECHNYNTESGCKFGNKCAFVHRCAEEHPSKKPKVNGDRTVVAMLKDTRQLRCVFQNAEPPKSSSIVYAPNSRIDLKKRRKDKSDAPAEMRGDWPKIS